MRKRGAGYSLNKAFTTQTDDLAQSVRTAQLDTESQLKQNDSGVAFRILSAGGLEVSQPDAKGNVRRVTIGATVAPSDAALVYQEGTGAPTTTQFPTDGNWGWYYDTAAPALYAARNRAGTIIFPAFQSISGSLQTGQHGNRSAEAATMHAFSQLSGTLAFAQHGALGGLGGTNQHDFTQINGAITAAQHGNLASGALHSAVTTSVNGFMLATDKVILDNATTVAAAANTLVLRNGSGNIFANAFSTLTGYFVGATQVVTSRQAAVTAPTGGATIDTQARTAINDIINKMQIHGLIS